jgi:hypothetical protein
MQRAPLVISLLALVAAIAGPAWASHQQSAAMSLASSVTVVKRTTTLTNNQVIELEAPCPSGTKVFSGGAATTGQFTQWITLGPARVGNKYLAYAYMPPVNIQTGVGRQTATITAVAYCAKAGKAVVI